jgi:hypothetical protein
MPREEVAQALGNGRWILDHQEVPRVRHDEAIRLREPGGQLDVIEGEPLDLNHSRGAATEVLEP